MSTWSMMNLQDSNSFILTLMIYFHDFILMILLMILLMIMYIMMWFLLNKLINRNILHNQLIEIIWTLIPMIILIFMVIPSLKILYNVEEYLNPYMTIKILGHQWYWSYEYSDFKNIEFDSFMIKLLNINKFRLLDVDNRLILPYNFKIRGLVSSIDVIHSWAMPSLGIKIDAIPGRINQFMIYINRSGLFFGQCSEICGLNHSFMPIVLEVTNLLKFFNWLKNLS
uniref:Cytochrome c oxidase subunit 2 n=1 Tax=Eumacrocentrus sp. QL-2013 TaxID=1421594 RepID=A0A0A6ZKQ9_9HYME|nr:cytochrome c oxidase subunit II [Eumacrocentrus sp. QL-2013]